MRLAKGTRMGIGALALIASAIKCSGAEGYDTANRSCIFVKGERKGK